MVRDDERSRLARWRGIAGLGVRRVVDRATRTDSRQLTLSIAGIAVSVALMLLVTSVALGLATGGSVSGTTADYWILPDGSADSVVTPVEGQQLGRVHDVTGRIERMDGVSHATPLLASVMRVETAGDDTEYVLVVGIVPDEAHDRVVGFSPASLTPGDPYYANGTYDGERTGEAVLSVEAATTLNRSTGDSLTLAGGRQSANRTFAVVGTNEGRSPGIGQLPVVLVHLSEFQVITGADDGDTANQVLVGAASDDVRPRIERVYPQSTVLSRDEYVRRQVESAQLPVAVGAAALVVAVVVGTLFVVTTMGFELAADSRTRVVLSVLGVSRGSLALLVASQTLAVTVLGGLVGVLLGVAAALVTNAATTTFTAAGPVARLHPALPAYGLGVAVAVGLLSVPTLFALRLRNAAVDRPEEW